mmetsp:Transcript_26722/g.48144  ORF Transcript_26722/g.48144 Transcript_26722/m.48144 type:complete len:161 (+) Transcript_26722:574-1056(+)
MLHAAKKLDVSNLEAKAKAGHIERSESPPSFMLCSFEGGYSTRPVTDRRHKALTKRTSVAKRVSREFKETLPPIHSITPTVDKSFGKGSVTRTSSHFYKPDIGKGQTKRKPSRHLKQSSNNSASPSKREPVRLRQPSSKRSFTLSNYLGAERFGGLKSRA